MERKIIGILVVTLLIATAVLPVVTSVNDLKDIEQVSIINKKYEYTQINDPPDEVLTVGDCDGFIPPIELTYPFPVLLAWVAENYYYSDTIDCDEDLYDRFWVHTFDLEGVCNNCISCITKATLSITVKNRGENDGFGFGCIETIHDKWDEGDTLINWGVPYTSPSYTIGTIVVDIEDYPSTFNEMIDHGRLDVYVQDDSMVDCAILEIWCCDCVTPPPDLVSWWPLDEGTGITSDDIADGNDGTWQGSPVPVAGYVDGALNFPTTNDYVLVKNDDSLNFDDESFSIDCWVYPIGSSNGEPRTIISKRAGTASAHLGYCLFINEDGNLAFILGKGNSGYKRFDMDQWGQVPDNTWTFVAVVVGRAPDYTTPQVRLYKMNPNNVGMHFPIPDSISTVTNTGDLWIGKDHFIGNHNFRGIIDELEIYNQPLNEGELQQICFAGGHCGKCKPEICCQGAFVWTNVKPGETEIVSFNVRNCGDPGSKLDWEICDVPIWSPGGDFSFNPNHGVGVTTTDPDQVMLTVTAPSAEEQTYSGEIKICNKHNPNEYCTILVSLTTPKNKAINTPFIQFLEDLLQNHPYMFPLIRQIMRL